MASAMPYVRQKAPMMPGLVRGSSCFAPLAVGACVSCMGHSATLRQSLYVARISSASAGSPSPVSPMNSASRDALGQYMRRLGS